MYTVSVCGERAMYNTQYECAQTKNVYTICVNISYRVQVALWRSVGSRAAVCAKTKLSVRSFRGKWKVKM